VDIMNWNNIDFSEKCQILGDKGEQFVYDKLIQKYPPDKFLILDLHFLCEMDWVIIDKEKKEIIEIYKVKTTTRDKKEFSAGNIFQLRVFELQQKKKQRNMSFIHYSLYVLRADNNFWKDGNLNVISEEIYPLDKIKIDTTHGKWQV